MMNHIKFFLTVLSMGIIFSASSQNISEIKAEDLLQRLEKGGDTTYLVNFWATWCAPCVKELPLFEEINEQYSDQNVKVILVSVDFKKGVQAKLKTFIEKREIQSEVLYLNENDPNEWIPKFTDEWEGVIPATLLFNSNKNQNVFKSSAFEENELKEFLIENGVIVLKKSVGE